MAQSVRHVVPWAGKQGGGETASNQLWPIRLLVSILAIYAITKATKYLARLYQLNESSSGGGAAATATTAGEREERRPPLDAAAAATRENYINKLGRVAVIALHTTIIMFQAVLLYHVSGTLETLIAIRVILLYLLLLVSIIFAIGAAADSEPPAEVVACLSHIISTLQTYLLPGMWDRMDEGLPDRLYIVYALWYAVFVWGVFSLPLFFFLTDEGKTSQTSRDSAGRDDEGPRRQEHLAGQRDRHKRRHCAIAIGYLLIDLVLSVFLNYKSLKGKR